MPPPPPKAAALLWSALQSRQSFFAPYGPAALTADFLLNVGAILFAITAYSSAPLLLDILLISPAIIALFLPAPNDGKKAPRHGPSAGQSGAKPGPPPEGDQGLPLRPFLTFYRGAMMTVTCLAILAVDFPIFPRRFAKVENWGTSLMDLGVGSFVFSAGVVSARSLLKARSTPQTKATRLKSFPQRFLTSVRHSIPLLILGLIRLYSVKGLDYAEHVTEYGVHWNFFFTLALLGPFVELSDLITTHIVPSYELLALIFALIYEVLLATTHLKRYILISPRGPDLLSKNREGVFSFTGYLAIFLAGRGSGAVVLAPNAPVPKSTKPLAASTHAWRERRALLYRLVARSAVWILLYVLSSHYFGLNLSVSRRLANLPYVLWVVAFNNSQILLFCAIETVCFQSAYLTQNKKDAAEETSSRIMQAFNSNGLVVFLVANLLTGLVNLTINTLEMGGLAAMGVLGLYAVLLTGFALGLQRFGIRVKL
jgi:glucosaminylphosphatidylinositol acyltransferase